MELHLWYCPDCEEEHEDPEGFTTHCRCCGLIVATGFIDDEGHLYPTRQGYLGTHSANRRLCDDIINKLPPRDKMLVSERSRVICEERGWMPRTNECIPADYAYRSFIFALKDMGFWPTEAPIAVRRS